MPNFAATISTVTSRHVRGDGMSTVLTFHWSGLGFLSGPVRHRRQFDSFEIARDFRERVMEGRVPEARYRVRTDDGVIRRLGTADACYEVQILNRKGETRACLPTTVFTTESERPPLTAGPSKNKPLNPGQRRGATMTKRSGSLDYQAEFDAAYPTPIETAAEIEAAFVRARLDRATRLRDQQDDV